MKKDPELTKAKKDVLDNLDAIQMSLETCVNEGMIDYNSSYYNELSDLIEDARIVNTWEELMEIIALAKTLETDIDAWFSMHGKTTISLPWPHIPSN